jgi:hypothetical protein
MTDQATGALAAASAPISAVRGKDGWLFLDYDTNGVMSQVYGRQLLTEQQLNTWQRLLENRVAWLERRGAAYFFTVAPVPHVVFPDKLPQPGAIDSDRPVLQLLRHLDRERSFARVIYPVEQLTARRDELIYTKTNSHWTDRGAFLAYEQLAAALESRVPMRRVEETEIEWVERMAVGDLGVKITPQEASPHVTALMKSPGAQVVTDNAVFNQGRRAEYRCPAAPDLTCLVLGTSSALNMVHVLAESFGRLVYGNISSLDYSLVDEVEPDVVVSIFGERFMVRVPTDVGAPTLEELEAQKRAAGTVFPPSAGQWKGRLVQPPSA